MTSLRILSQLLRSFVERAGMAGEALDISWRLAIVFALVGLNGFFVAAEFSLVSVRRTLIEQIV